MDDKCEWALLRFSRQRSVCSTSDMLKFTIRYWTAKTPKCQETSWSIQAITWPMAQKTKKPRQFQNSWRLLSWAFPACFAADYCKFSQQQAALSSRSEHSLQPVQGHRSWWIKLTYSSEIVLFFSCAVLCVSPVTRSCSFQWNHCSLSSLIPQSLSIGVSGFYALTIPNGLNAHTRSTSGFISLNMPFSKSTVISISARNCFKISTGSWE